MTPTTAGPASIGDRGRQHIDERLRPGPRSVHDDGRGSRPTTEVAVADDVRTSKVKPHASQTVGAPVPRGP